MPFVDLLRTSVLLSGAVATVLGAIAVLVAAQDSNQAALIVAGGWWIVAGLGGTWLGRTGRSGAAISRVLAGARTATTLSPESPGRIAFLRLWPVGLFAIVAGGLAAIAPQVAAIGAGYAIGFALAWRHRESAVTAIEERDGVRFYVEPSSAFEPLRLVRTPGLGRDRIPAGHPPPPPSARSV
jgi:hypothetical protein